MQVLTYPLHLRLELAEVLGFGDAEVPIGILFLWHAASWVSRANGEHGCTMRQPTLGVNGGNRQRDWCLGC